LGYPSMKIRGEPLYHFVFFLLPSMFVRKKSRAHGRFVAYRMNRRMNRNAHRINVLGGIQEWWFMRSLSASDHAARDVRIVSEGGRVSANKSLRRKNLEETLVHQRFFNSGDKVHLYCRLQKTSERCGMRSSLKGGS
jgi:hypothetical protein